MILLKEVLNEKRILNNKCKKRIFEKNSFFISKFFQIKRFSMIFLGGIFMNVKAIMCDIDGTLLSSDGVVAPKTEELIEILKLHHIDLKEIVTFGDADNGYDMILNAGVGVVMANGSDKTKSVADYITDDNDYDGIGNYIEKFILGEQKWIKLFLLILMEHY